MEGLTCDSTGCTGMCEDQVVRGGGTKTSLFEHGLWVCNFYRSQSYFSSYIWYDITIIHSHLQFSFSLPIFLFPSFYSLRCPPNAYRGSTAYPIVLSSAAAAVGSVTVLSHLDIFPDLDQRMLSRTKQATQSRLLMVTAKTAHGSLLPSFWLLRSWPSERRSCLLQAQLEGGQYDDIAVVSGQNLCNIYYA